ncbi:hypothetical protein [Eubacterium sp. 1001713B170207_170306_E7]|uniref:hypothetical protein n=1 Tax=Eubacterium sp. 1001713B170207_170306_E7 TaxID=2787097 RepID=UPI001899DF4A|nr:hypothetical protein [Eubacterium sp. 1001713B170207_170306_E7]
MINLIKVEFYQLLHNKFFYVVVLLILSASYLTLGFFENQVGIAGNDKIDALRVFSTILLMSGIWNIGISSIGAFFAGQDTDGPSAKTALTAGHSRLGIFTAKVVSFLIFMNILMFLFPISGICIEMIRMPLYLGVHSDTIGIYIGRIVILTVLINCAIFNFILALKFVFQKSGITAVVTALILFGQYILVAVLSQKGITLFYLPFTLQQYSVLVNVTLEEILKILMVAIFYNLVFLCIAYCFFFHREIK